MNFEILKVLLTLMFTCYVIFFITQVLIPYIKDDQHGMQDSFRKENN